jgi:hypothetical protein
LQPLEAFCALEAHTSDSRPATKRPTFLDLTSFKHTSLWVARQPELVAFVEDYQWPATS